MKENSKGKKKCMNALKQVSDGNIAVLMTIAKKKKKK